MKIKWGPLRREVDKSTINLGDLNIFLSTTDRINRKSANT